MSEDRWTPMLHTRYRFAMWRRDVKRALNRARYRMCRRTRRHVTDGWCGRCGTLTIHVRTSAPEEKR